MQFLTKLGIVEDVYLDDIPLLLLAKFLQSTPHHHVVLVVSPLDGQLLQLLGEPVPAGAAVSAVGFGFGSPVEWMNVNVVVFERGVEFGGADFLGGPAGTDVVGVMFEATRQKMFGRLLADHFVVWKDPRHAFGDDRPDADGGNVQREQFFVLLFVHTQYADGSVAIPVGGEQAGALHFHVEDPPGLIGITGYAAMQAIRIPAQGQQHSFAVF